MVGQDGETHQAAVGAASLFDAVDRAIHMWAWLWWYRPNAVYEVRADGRTWKVSAERIRRWRTEGR